MRTMIYVAVEIGRRWAVCLHDMQTGDTNTHDPVRTGLPTYAEALQAALAVAGDYFAAESPPAWTAAGMTGFWREGHLHCIQALAVA